MAALGILTVSVYDGALKTMKVREPAKDAGCRHQREATSSHYQGHEMCKKKHLLWCSDGGHHSKTESCPVGQGRGRGVISEED